jgi:hypothetical protein
MRRRRGRHETACLSGRALLIGALLCVPAMTRAERVVIPLRGFQEVP